MVTISDLEKRLKQVESCFDKKQAESILKPYYAFVEEYKDGKIANSDAISRAYIMLGGLLDCGKRK